MLVIKADDNDLSRIVGSIRAVAASRTAERLKNLVRENIGLLRSVDISERGLTEYPVLKDKDWVCRMMQSAVSSEIYEDDGRTLVRVFLSPESLAEATKFDDQGRVIPMSLVLELAQGSTRLPNLGFFVKSAYRMATSG